MKSFGFTTLQTTLLGCVDGVVESTSRPETRSYTSANIDLIRIISAVVTIWTAVTLVKRIPNSRAYIGAVYFIPNVLGGILILTLPWSNKIGLLFSIWITGVGTSGFVLSLGWVTAVTAGHTKRITVNAIMLMAYCIGELSFFCLCHPFVFLFAIVRSFSKCFFVLGNLAGPQMWQDVSARS